MNLWFVFLSLACSFRSSHSLLHVASGNSSPWANLTEAEDNVSFYLTVYGCLAGANSLFTLLRAFLFAYGGICAAKVMHHRLLTSVLKVWCVCGLLFLSCHRKWQVLLQGVQKVVQCESLCSLVLRCLYSVWRSSLFSFLYVPVF